ncbi:MAG: hypothetical protein AB1657_02930 [Candidatus Micrarchaeota archaeon]
MDFQGTRMWRLAVAASLAFLVLAVLAELLFMDWLAQHVSVQAIEYLTLFFTFILMCDIYLSFLKAADKKAFLKKNALKILILLPWGTIFRALSFLRLEGMFAEVPILADLLAAEKPGAAGKTVLIAEKTKRLPTSELILIRPPQETSPSPPSSPSYLQAAALPLSFLSPFHL